MDESSEDESSVSSKNNSEGMAARTRSRRRKSAVLAMVGKNLSEQVADLIKEAEEILGANEMRS